MVPDPYLNEHPTSAWPPGWTNNKAEGAHRLPGLQLTGGSNLQWGYRTFEIDYKAPQF